MNIKKTLAGYFAATILVTLGIVLVDKFVPGGNLTQTMRNGIVFAFIVVNSIFAIAIARQLQAQEQ